MGIVISAMITYGQLALSTPLKNAGRCHLSMSLLKDIAAPTKSLLLSQQNSFNTMLQPNSLHVAALTATLRIGY